jgi:hypothetical protein
MVAVAAAAAEVVIVLVVVVVVAFEDCSSVFSYLLSSKVH